VQGGNHDYRKVALRHGGLTAEEVAADRRQAAPAAGPLDADQRVEQHLLGVHYADNDAAGGELNARAFASRRDFEQQNATAEALYTGAFYADNENRVEVEDAWLINLRLGDAWRLGDGGTRLGAHLGVRNLFDEAHFANVRINANAWRYFEPAAGRTFHAGLELSL
jgi:hypothetical protein